MKNDLYELTKKEQEKIRQFGSDMMDLSFYEKDDEKANKMSDIGSRLCEYGNTWCIDILDLEKEEVEIIDYVKSELIKPENQKKLLEYKEKYKVLYNEEKENILDK